MIDDPHVEKKLRIGDQEVPVWFYGNPKNPPLIFLHGYFRGFSDYIGDLPPRYLKKKFYVIAFDLPGFGKSKKLERDEIGLIDKVLSEFVPNKKVLIMAVSYGGAVALRFTYEKPDKVKGLIICGTPYYKGLRLILITAKIIKYRDSNLLNLFRFFLFLHPKNISAIKVPTLLFYSKDDRLAPPRFGRKFQKQIPHATLIEVKERSHGWLLHRIDETGLLSEIEKFYDSIH